jgi:hypothetical protein
LLIWSGLTSWIYPTIASDVSDDLFSGVDAALVEVDALEAFLATAKKDSNY